MKAGRLVYACAGVLIVALAVTAIPQAKPVQAAGAAPVIVTNTPLPVSAAQSGTWTVGISGNPTVNVGTLPAVAIASSQVVGVRTAPGDIVDVRDADSKNVFTAQLCVASGTLICGGTPSFVRGPVGEYLAIDQISGECAGSAGAQVLAAALVVTDATGTASSILPLVYPSASSAYDGFFFARTRIVAVPFSPPNAAVIALGIQRVVSGNDAQCIASVLGHSFP